MSNDIGPPTEPDSGSPIRAGSVFGNWKLDSHIADGGYGSVWLATNTTGDHAAVKFLVNQRGRSRFLREHELAVQQEGHWTPRVLQAGIDAAVPWIAFEHLADETLASQAPLNDDDLRSFALHLWLAISSLHRAGISHRDITPGNVFFKHGRVQLIDFGLGKFDNAAQPGFNTTALGGTPGFAAPEQFTEDATVGDAADIWAWGSVVYFAATGASIYSTVSEPHQTLMRYMDAITHRLPAELTDVPEWLHTALQSALRVEPSERSRDTIARALPANDQEREYLLLALELFEVQGKPIIGRSGDVQYSSQVPKTVADESPQEVAALRARLHNLENAASQEPELTRSKSGRAGWVAAGVLLIAATAGGVLIASQNDEGETPQSSSSQPVTILSTISEPDEVAGADQLTEAVDTTIAALAADDANEPEPEPEMPVQSETDSATESSGEARPVATLDGAPDTTDRGTVLGTDHPGAMSIELDQAGCESSSDSYLLKLPQGEWNVVGNIGLSDDTPQDANVQFAAGTSSATILTTSRRNGSFDLSSVSDEVEISVEVLSAFGVNCGEMPIELLIFDSFIR